MASKKIIQKNKNPSRNKAGGKARVGLAARYVAAKIHYDVIDNGAQLQASLDPGLALFKTMTARDRALVSQILYTAIRRKGFIDLVLSEMLADGLPKSSGLLNSILHVALAQILFLDVADHAAVFLAVETANKDHKARRFKKLINGVLRNVLRQKDDLIGKSQNLQKNLPAWVLKKWVSYYGHARTDKILEHAIGLPYLDLQFISENEAASFSVQGLDLPFGGKRLPLQKRIPEIPGFEKGVWWVQDVASSIPAKLFDFKPGQTVADLCAAPGGKTIQLCLAGGDVTAIDISGSRLERLQENLSRMNLSANIVVSDVLDWKPDAQFDAILLDAPCSATGTFRKNPDVLWHRKEEDLKQLAQLQLNLLMHASQFLKEGGQLVYCVCSMEPEEGEDVIEKFLQENSTYKRKKVNKNIDPYLSELITKDGDIRTDGSQLLKYINTSHSLVEDLASFSQNYGLGMDGFYISSLERIKGSS